MARFAGTIGYAISEEDPDALGNWVNVVQEFQFTGILLKDTKNTNSGETFNTDITLANSISIIADPYAIENFSLIKYVTLDGVRWSVTSVEIRPPRLFIQIGKVYDGPTI